MPWVRFYSGFSIPVVWAIYDFQFSRLTGAPAGCQNCGVHVSGVTSLVHTMTKVEPQDRAAIPRIKDLIEGITSTFELGQAHWSVE